jgi:two-component system chemotaxis sensor kinase CheA
MNENNISSAISDLKNIFSVMTELTDHITPLDLGEMAQIHEHAMKLCDISSTNSGEQSKLLGEIGGTIASTLQEIIMENVTEPEKSLENICQSIKSLNESLEITETLPEIELLTSCVELLKNPSSALKDSKPTQLQGQETETSLDSDTPQTAEVNPTEISANYQQEPLFLQEQEFDYVRSFLTECNEHIENIESGLLTLEQTPEDTDKINELFRPFHTIKGMAGFLNLRDVQSLTHEVETLLDLGRKGKLTITPERIDVIFEALDILKVQINSIAEYMVSPNGSAISQPPITSMIKKVKQAATGTFGQKPLSKVQKGDRKKIGEILSEDGKVSDDILEFALDKQKKSGTNQPLGEILASMDVVSAKDVSQALRKQSTTTVQDTIVRVDIQKLDNLVNMVGELVIIQTQLEQNENTRQSSTLNRLVEQVSKITRDVQEMTMSMRMVTLSQTFQKMGRVVRDLAKKVDKKINYELEGEDTELDKNVIQELSDPLMHMIRNAVDHGVESPEDRVKAGKPEAGTVKLRAFHQAGNIIIEISDDGKGLDKDKLIQKAVEKGVITADTQLTEQQAYNLIMAAGFSMAEKVTDISGRGVGMDVVKKNIEKLRGKVDISSVKGKGTTFTIRLPLTLAVIDGMLIRVGSQKFILPTLTIIKSMSPNKEQIKTIQGKGQILNLNGEIFPLISLTNIFRISDGVQDATDGMVVICQAEDKHVGIVLSELLSQQQVVIKTLGQGFKNIKGITGGAILGDGTIGLILEPAGLMDYILKTHLPN